MSSRCFLLAALSVLLVACGNVTKVEDPDLKPIQEMLDAQLPAGTPLAIVNQFVTARGYPSGSAGKPGDLQVIIRHIDPQKLKPVTARVTFHFDKNDKLITTEIVRTMNEPIPPAQQAEPRPETSQPQASPQPPQ
ncbi:MAG TPA: hypothetical protein VMT75_06310 [Candidatus Saccharimonadales bacterium]|nr:hypothetical protein [Candidatus Saccharimonadales bacterium]